MGPFPQFEVPIGQHNLPPWDEVQATLEGIFDRRYYTNHGPLAQELESNLAKLWGVKHAIAVTNAMIGLVIAAKAVDWEGETLVSALAPRATKDALLWAGLTPRELDVDPLTHQMDVGKLRAALETPDAQFNSVLVFHHWGNAELLDSVQKVVTDFQLGLICDASHAVGCEIEGRPLAAQGPLNIVSFNEVDLLNASEGGCVCTNDDRLAARIRNMRSSYGAGPPMVIPLTGNARMSEAQAGMALLSLQRLRQSISHNHRCFKRYQQRLEAVPGVRLLSQSSRSGCAYAVVEVAPKIANRVCDSLRRARIPFRAAYDVVAGPGPATPVANQLRQNTLQLPLGHFVDEPLIDAICDTLRDAA